MSERPLSEKLLSEARAAGLEDASADRQIKHTWDEKYGKNLTNLSDISTEQVRQLFRSYIDGWREGGKDVPSMIGY